MGFRELSEEEIKEILLKEEGHNLKDYVCLGCGKLALSLNIEGFCFRCV